VWVASVEVSTQQLREKSITLATASSFACGLVVSFVNPYIQNPGYGDLGGYVGLLYGSFSVVAVIFVLFYVPEMKNRSLEELDELFEQRVSVWKFGSHKCTGIGAQVTSVQRGETMDNKAVVQHIEKVA
jgi:hypothetical protein